MKRLQRIKKESALLLALTLVLSGMALAEVRAALSIETDRMCSISFEVGGDLAGEFAELSEIPIPVEMYKVADVDEAGGYTALNGYEKLELDKVNSETTAADWEAKAQAAAAVVEEMKAEPTAEGILEGGKGTIADLSVGMYLVVAQTAVSEQYEYQFTPYLISLPNNYYGAAGNDDWVYDVTTGLKPGREDLFGSLVIDKRLESYNASLGSATFIFQVEGVKNGEKVYSDVVSLVFDGSGTKSVTVDQIPAGAEVTVTEIYSGASYELISAPSQTVVIAAGAPDTEDGNTEENAEDSAAVHVSFINRYNEKLNGSASVVNHFTNEEGVWSVEQQTDSTQAAE